MNTMLASISPQAKTQAVALITTSLGLSTILQYIPLVLGSIATIVGIMASGFIAYKANQQTKMAAEKHKEWRVDREREKEKYDLEMELLRKQLDERD